MLRRLYSSGSDNFFLPDYFSDSCYQALVVSNFQSTVELVSHDPSYQYWIMSALTNDPFKLARYAGFYKAIQSAVRRTRSKKEKASTNFCLFKGAAGSYGMDAVATPFLNEIVCCVNVHALLAELDAHLFHFQLGSWILTLASFPLALLVVRTIKETNYDDEKVREITNRLLSTIIHHLWFDSQQMIFVDDLQAGDVGAQEVIASLEKGSIKSETPRV